jgi:hypothetical protein
VACWMNFGGLPPEKVRRSMRLFAEEIMPAFRTPAVVGGRAGARSAL